MFLNNEYTRCIIDKVELRWWIQLRDFLLSKLDSVGISHACFEYLNYDLKIFGIDFVLMWYPMEIPWRRNQHQTLLIHLFLETMFSLHG